MKVLLVGINAKYIHSNLAIRYLKEYVKEDHIQIDIKEFTINQSVDHIVYEIYKMRTDVVGLSCYIWNIKHVIEVTNILKKISPKTKICLGGPEVSYDKSIWDKIPYLDVVISGEGEETFREYIVALKNQKPIKDVLGIMFKHEGQVVANSNRNAISLDQVSFVYKDGFDEFTHRIIYYETMRGCPFNCQYCLSSVEQGVRYHNLDRIEKELKFFLEHKVMQVKFVDRTFNCSKKHAMAIWKFLHENDNQITNFHFEISADLLDDEMMDFLGTVRQGLFQFEIGVQSTHFETLSIIQRKSNLERLYENVYKLKGANNIHLHLDLIAGLPKESYSRFKQSFNDVYCLQPEKLQLGFLKVLKGSGLETIKEKYGIIYRDEPPYEILATDDLSYEKLEQLKLVEEMVDHFYNSGNFTYSIRVLESYFSDPFAFYEELSHYWEQKGYHTVKHSKIALYNFIYLFAKHHKLEQLERIGDLLKLDLCLQEKVKKYPKWMEQSWDYKDSIYDFYKEGKNISLYLPQLRKYSSKQISRMAHIERFRYDVTQIIEGKKIMIDKKETFMLFNYYDRDKMRHNARVYPVNLN